MKEEILEAYMDGKELTTITEKFNTTYTNVKNILITYKEDNRNKRTFTDDFKKTIAERDINGVPRSAIASELDINVNTVKKACEKFGQSLKDRATSANEFTRIDGSFNLGECPSCSSKKVNEVDDDTIYCKDCGNEHIIKDSHVLKVNWEYLPED